MYIFGVDVDPRKPAAVAWMAVVPAEDVIRSSIVSARLQILDDVLIGRLGRVDSRLRAFDGQAEGVGDDEGVAHDLALHQTHHFDRTSGACVHDHFEQGDGGYANVFEVVGVFSPWLLFGDGFLLFDIVAVEGVAVRIHEFDGVLEL